jgi:hypothetical protein
MEYARPADEGHERSAQAAGTRWRRWWLGTAGRASLVKHGARLAGRALQKGGGRLLQWAGEANHMQGSAVERQEQT